MRRFIFIMLALTTIGTTALAQSNSALQKKHDKIIRDFPAVTHISPSDLDDMSTSDIMIFDVREPKEYAVSHIDGAINVSPDIGADKFMSRYGQISEGKTIVLYCSVGHRSSALAQRLEDRGIDQDVYNLQGGAFNWHNEGRDLVGGEGNTRAIHPYNIFWGRMINDRSEARYSHN